MAFKQPSRRDDFESLFYILIFMLNDQVLWVGDEHPTEGVEGLNNIFEAILNWKKQHSLIEIAELFSKEFDFPLKNPSTDQ